MKYRIAAFAILVAAGVSAAMHGKAADAPGLALLGIFSSSARWRP